MKLTFHGAAGEVTGSQHLLEISGRKILFDCGLFQGRRAESRRKNEKFSFAPKSIDAVILSHAHIDHCGNLPRLYRQGFRGPVYCTEATADVAEIMLKDAGKIQEEDARYLAKHLKKGHPPVEPLYTRDDVAGLVELMHPLAYHQEHELASDIRIRFEDAGHILGSAITTLDVEEQHEWKRIIFSGDLGRRDIPLLRDPTPIGRCDVLICESTYGNRVHPPATDIKAELKRILTEAVTVEGRVIVPAFSLGRTQQLVYFLNELFNDQELPRIPVFVDSPLSSRITRIFRRHLDILDKETQQLLQNDPDPFGFPWLTYIGSHQESKDLNSRKGAMLIIAASGMCEGGRVVHHLAQAVSNIENTIALIGYQAGHTLGRRIADRQKYVKIFDREFPLKAKVERLDGLSAHADVHDFKWWFELAAKQGGIGQAFLVHGEPDSAKALAEVLAEYCDEQPIVPNRGDSFEL